ARRRSEVKKEIIHIPVLSDGAQKRGVPLSFVVKAGDFLHVSGMPPINLQTGAIETGDIHKQTEISLEPLNHCLEIPASPLDKVFKTTIFITNSAYFEDVNRIYARYFSKDPPARSFCTVGSWPMKFDIEIECVAIA